MPIGTCIAISVETSARICGRRVMVSELYISYPAASGVPLVRIFPLEDSSCICRSCLSF